MPKLTVQQGAEIIKSAVAIAHLLSDGQREIFQAKFAALKDVITGGLPQHADGSAWTDDELQAEADAIHDEVQEILARSAGGI